MAIGKVDLVPEFFVGQGDLILFDEVSNYATATLATFANPKSLGNIHLDSTNYTGEAPALESLRNEQGKAYYYTATAGTFGMEFFVPSVTPEMLKLLYGAEDIDATLTDTNGLPDGADVVGFMHELVVLERPFMIANETKNMALIVPRAKLVASPSVVDKVTGSLVALSAADIDTDALKTLMMLYGNLVY